MAGIYEVLGILGYVGALLTGLYTFRMIFRAFFGDPSPEAVELEHGHIAHAEVPTNPANGEAEDIDVGFPGPEHAIAEREPAMKVAMGLLAILAVIGGLIQLPGVDHVRLELPELRRWPGRRWPQRRTSPQTVPPGSA